MITYRKANPEDIYPAFELALRVFIEFEAPNYDQDAVGKLKSDCIDNEVYINNYVTGKHLMYVALEGNKIVGFVNERGNGHISMLFVDGLYHRQGIATTLMNNIVCDLKLRGFDKITLNSSPYGLPFYRYFGFKPTDTEQKKDGFIFAPMSYEPNEIWDVYDSNRNKTGRFAERGRKMATGDYHLVVHVWKHNGKGEWLIDKRAPARGTSIDGKWETTGGAALAGDDSLTAALRETKEELGIDLDPQKGVLFHSTARHGNDGHTWLQDAWVFEHNCPIEDVRFQEGETCDAMWASPDKIREMMAVGEFLSEWFYPYFEEMVEKWGGTMTLDDKSIVNAVIQRFADVLDTEMKVKPMEMLSFPADITTRLSGYTCTKDRVGCSSAGVFRYEHNGDVLYLKITKVFGEIRRERDLLAWLKGKVPVPDVVYYGEQNGNAFLLMAKANGFMACDCPRDAVGEQDKVHEPITQTVKLLADALQMLQAIDIYKCPVENTLDYKLKAALYNIEHDLVDTDDFEEGNDFDSPMELYQWLAENRPPEELCFTHGDFCLPNIFIDGKTVTGFIDIGRGGIADKWQDIALCVRSLGYNLRHTEQQKYIDLLFTHLGIQPDEAKIRYYILLDELF